MGQSKWVEWKQGLPVTIDGFMRMPLLPQVFSQSFSYFDHFVCPPIASSTQLVGFNTTELTDGSVAMATGDSAADGWLNLVGGANDGEGIQVQGSEAFLPAAGKDIYFVTRVRISDVDDIDWNIGLCSIDSNIFSTQPTEMIAFGGNDGDANLDFQVRNGGTGDATDTGTDLSNGTAIVLGFHVSGTTSVTPYINGTAGTAVTSNIPTGTVALTFGMLNGGTTANNILGIDYIGVMQVS